ncbi:Ankyrin repeat and sterile alpha motif domain-containing protein 1B [Liparis tanakae]|uniref:Ankyrin repeat and sterile alpha motif domain-containing protein 1B n=1 Tax=Liparis tanakae TaxID=230148 RepID=A0A4Z2F7I3_9TELE|nr:Ankyrin repeat and sterile alpha motif domain-containing protein 1B [Liparis tanakae]
MPQISSYRGNEIKNKTAGSVNLIQSDSVTTRGDRGNATALRADWRRAPRTPRSPDTFPVLKISLIGHRKRILASLGDRLHEDTPQKPPRAVSLREPGGNHTPPQLSPSVGQQAYTAGVPGGSLDVQHLIMQADARRRQRGNDNYFEDVPRSKLERQMAQVSMAGEWCEPITLRPPNEATSSTPVQYWQHHPEKLIFQSCDYEAYTLRNTQKLHDGFVEKRRGGEEEVRKRGRM